MKKNLKKGFTLIELLVVVAIIGVLASVVLASLNTARTKGANAALKSNLANIRAQAEMLFDSYGCYANAAVCSASAPAVAAPAACATGNAIANSIFANAGFYSGVVAATTAGGSVASCSATVGGTAWAVAVVQKGATAAAADSGWCVDSTGKSKSITVATLDQTGINAEVAAGACVE